MKSEWSKTLRFSGWCGWWNGPSMDVSATSPPTTQIKWEASTPFFIGPRSPNLILFFFKTSTRPWKKSTHYRWFSYLINSYTPSIKIKFFLKKIITALQYLYLKWFFIATADNNIKKTLKLRAFISR